MRHPQKHIEALEKSAAECELISQLVPNKSTQRARLADSSLSPNQKPGSWPGFYWFSGPDGLEDLRREGRRRHGERR